MTASEVARRKSLYAHAREREPVFSGPSHEAAMIFARAAMADLQHIRRDILTLRETMAFGEVR